MVTCAPLRAVRRSAGDCKAASSNGESLNACFSGSRPGRLRPPTAALVVVDDEALQYVVDLVERHGELQRCVVLDRGLVLEVTEAGRRQHDPLEREILRRGKTGESQQAQHGRDQQTMHEISPVYSTEEREPRL